MSLTPRILIIDDERYVLRLFRTILERAGYSVLTADDGDLGIRTYAEAKPDLVLLDIAMPGLDGVEVLERIRQLDADRTTPIMIISAHSQSSLREVAEKFQVDAYMEKPITSQELLNAIKDILAMH